jgi:hypothetical protein
MRIDDHDHIWGQSLQVCAHLFHRPACQGHLAIVIDQVSGVRGDTGVDEWHGGSPWGEPYRTIDMQKGRSESPAL